LYRLYEGSGLDTDLIFKRSEIDIQQFDDPLYRIPHDKLMRMWEIAAELSGDPNFSLHLARDVPNVLPLNTAGYLAMSSRNLREMLESLKRYMKILSDVGHLRIKESDNLANVTIDFSGGKNSNRQHSDFWQAFFYRMINANIGGEMPLIEVGFRHDKPQDTSAYTEYFHCELKFGQPENYFLFPRVYLDYQLISADPSIHKIHEQQATKQLHELTEKGILNKVKRLIFESLPAENVELKDISESLNLTPRTVQRHLADEGTTFKKLADEARKEYTISEIENTDLAIAEIAYQLGYRDLSSFYRAFKRWTGKTPINYREEFLKED
jgi:AraC-like DNA-binding protein